MRCDLCGEFYESGRIFVAAQASACNECISNLIDNEAERKGVAAEEQNFRAFHGGGISGESERQALKESGRSRE